MNFESLESKKCLVLIGKAGAGKDTVADMIYGLFRGQKRPRSMRFSEPLKRAVADIFGWSAQYLGDMKYKEERLPYALLTYDGRPMWTRREVLQYIGTDVFRTMDPAVWIKAALRDAAGRANMFDCNGFICTDCRFPNELEALVGAFKETFVVRLVKYGGQQTVAAAHASETEIVKLRFDRSYTIEAGDLTALHDVATVLSEYFKETDDAQ